MVSSKTTYVVVLDEEPGGLAYNRESYLLEDLGGVVPNVGDCLVDADAPVGFERQRAEYRTVKVVTARYFQPAGQTIGPRIHLAVRSRPGERFEQEAFLD